MKKALILVVIGILGIAVLLFSLMNGTLIWDGSVYVPNSVTVFDSERRPVKDASVALIVPQDQYYREYVDHEAFNQLLKGSHRFFESSNLGPGTLGGRFPAGGLSGLFRKKGRFTVEGDIIIRHPEFEVFQVSLRNLLHAYEISVDQTELELIAFLETAKAESAGTHGR